MNKLNLFFLFLISFLIIGVADAQKKKIKKHKRKPRTSIINTVHPYFALENIDNTGETDLRVGGMCIEGNVMYVATLEPNRTNKKPFHGGKVIKINNFVNADGKEKKIKMTTLIEGLYEPCAIAVIGNSLYVGEKKRILRFDGIDEKISFSLDDAVVLLDGASTENFHTFTIGFEKFIRDGKTYLCGNFTTAVLLGGKRDKMIPKNPDAQRGTNFIFGPVNGKERAEDVKIEYLAGGFRTPNGVEVGADNAVWVSDNQGIFNPSNELIRIKPGSFYGHFLYTKGGKASAFQPKAIDPVLGHPKGQTAATIHLPQGTVARSPSQPHVIRNRKGVLKPYNGQILLCEFTTGGMLRVFSEEVEGVWQGCVFHHSGGVADKKGNGGFTAGPNRIEEGPDGNYYIGQIGAGGLWWFNNTWSGLQRFRVKQESEVDANFNEILATRVVEGGFELEFLKPVPKGSITAEQVKVSQWTYQATQHYGGPPVGTQKLTVAKLSFDDSGKKVRLIIHGLKDDSPEFVIKSGTKSSENTGWVVHVKFDPKVEGESVLYTKEFWYSLHKKLGGKKAGAGDVQELTAEEKVHQQFQSLCLSCHVERDGGWVAPKLQGIFGRKQKVVRGGKVIEVVVDKDYIVKAIMNPMAEKPLKFKNGAMPPLGIGKESAHALADYIRKLK